jgi:hypothetical protein
VSDVNAADNSRARKESVRLEEIVERFEFAWRRGGHPALEDYLPADLDLRRTALVELVYADLEFRLKAGEETDADEYVRRYPELAGHRSALLGLRALAQRLRKTGPGPAHSPAAPAPASPPAPALPGYTVLEELGRGGMGVVYKARHLGLDRLVAVKVLLAENDGGTDHRTRFRREAEAVARLRHPNIVQIYTIGEQDGRPFFAMELAEGGNLAARTAAGPRPPREAAGLIETLARAVHHAHEHGLVHRDLKPANILLDGAGTPKVTDFGLVKELNRPARQTPSGAILGTPGYMAPEQAEGRASEVGPAADVYALGALLYEVLTGRPPFQGETPLDTVLQVLSEDPVAPSRLKPGVPPDLEAICLKCLRKAPVRRYRTALALAADLRGFLAGRRPAGGLLSRRAVGLALLVAAAVAAVALATALPAWRPWQTGRPPGQQELEQWWDSLGDREDAPEADRAMQSMVAAPAQTVPFLQGRLQPVPPADAGRIDGLMDQLADDREEVREGAKRDLARLGEAAQEKLRAALEQPAFDPWSNFRRKAAKDLLEQLEGTRLRDRRATHVLELIGTPEALDLLKSLGTGAPGADRTERAKAALGRRAGPPPGAR